MMSNLIVTGYPKSGNTWLTRLVGELVDCPVAGFWGFDEIEVAREGFDRVSEHKCYKSHFQLSELEKEQQSPDVKIIYVMRDPRDVIVSGANFFDFPRTQFLKRVLNKLPDVPVLDFETLDPLIAPLSYRVDRMLEAVTSGDEKVNYWCRVPWSEHVVPFVEDPQILTVRYEDLLVDAPTECFRILDYVGVERTEDEVAQAIHNQSFHEKRKSLEEEGKVNELPYLREGRKGGWTEVLNEQQKLLVEQELGDAMVLAGYEVESAPASEASSVA